MKLIKIIFLLLIVNSLHSQKDLKGIVIYTVKPNTKEKLKDETIKLDPIFNEVGIASTSLKYILKYKGLRSTFECENSLSHDDKNMMRELAKKIVSDNKYYSNLENNSLLYEPNGFVEENTLVKIDSIKNEWILINEEKLINNYRCYKAIKEKVTINSKGTFRFKIIAWYTPDIPLRFGPKEYNNLPGLILELKDTHYTFIANTINLNTKKYINTNIPNNINVISEIDYKKVKDISINNSRKIFGIKKNK